MYRIYQKISKARGGEDLTGIKNREVWSISKAERCGGSNKIYQKQEVGRILKQSKAERCGGSNGN